MLNIKNIEGKVVFSTPINKGCKRKYTLMQEDYISLVFNVAEPIYFRLGDNIYDGQFEITDLVSPRYNDSTAGYEYEVKFDAYYWKWKNKKFFYAPEFGAREASWSLTANLDTQLSIIIKNLNHLNYTYKGKAFEFSVDSTVKNVSKPLRYDNLSIIEALNLMAQTWECEWWVTDNIIHLGRCEYGTPVDFELNNNVEKMSRNEGKRTFATRVYAVGSERNITRKYRPVDSSITTNGIVQKRLTLPIDTPYIDAFPDMTQEEAIEQIVIFDDVYPKLISKVSNVEVKESSVKDKETQVVSKLWTYFISDDSLKFDKKYILPDTELRLVFQSGALNGLDFAVGFANNRFEIIRNEEYGRLLPDDILKPKVGDEFVLYGYDTELVSDALLPKAEQELKERAIEFVEKSKIDPSTYECHMMSDYMLNGGKVRTFEVGDRVRLISRAYFKDSRVSRIIGYEHPLDRPYDSPTYLVGETASYSHLEEIKADVKELTYKEKTFSGSGSNVYVIGQYDSTPATDRNTLSSQKSLNTFHRKDITDETDHLQKYNKGIEFGQYGKKKGAYINEEGIGDFEKVVSKDTDFKRMGADDVVTNTASINELITKLAKIHKLEVTDTATILKAVVKEYLSSEKFVSGFAGEGFRISQAINGDWSLEIDNLIVRKLFNVFEVVVQKISHQGGMVVHSPNGARITRVTDGGSYWKCEHDAETDFVKDDQVLCQNFSGKVKRYWRLVTSAGKGYINLSKSDCEANSAMPELGDEIVVLGNRTNINRQSAIMVVSVGANSPYMAYLSKINSYSLVDKENTRIGSLDGLVDKDFGALKGNGLFSENVYLKGVFRLLNGKTVEQEILSTNNNVEANRLELGGQIDQVKQDSKQQIDSVRTDFDVIEGQININVAETQRLVSMSNAQVTEATEASNKAQQNADLANKKALEAQANADKTKADATASNQAKIDTQKKADEAKLQADKANQEAIKAKNDADKAKEAKEASEGVLQSVTEKEASINVIAGQVDIKAKEAIESANRAVVAEANINTKADSIVMEASKQSAEKAIEGLDIGGRNILLDSDKGWVNSSYPTARIKFAEQLKDGEEFCVRIYGKLNENSSNHWHIYNSGGTVNVLIVPRSSYNKVGGYYEAVGKWRIGNSTNDAAYIYGIPNSKLENIIDKVIISRGNKATDWTQAPEDIEAQFQATNSKLELLSDKFSVEVAKTDGTRKELTALTQDHDEFKVQVIKDIDGAIDSNNEVIKSEFVVNEKGLGFRGNEIDMTGRVTYTSLNAEAQGKIDDAKRTADNAAQDIWDFRTEAGDLAYVDEVSLAMLDETIIEGGFIKTSLIEANSITADKINVESLESIRIRTGNLEVLDGAMIGNFKIENGSIVAYKPDGSKDWGNLTISRDFFKVGNNESYVMEGDNVFPDSSSPFFTCSSIICNTNYHDPTDFFFYQTKNIGLSIEVGKAEENIALNLTGGGISGFGLKVTYWTHANDNTVKDIDSYIIDTSGNSHKVFYVPHPKETWVGRVVIINNRGRRWLQAQAKSSSHSVSNIFRWGWNSSNSKWSLNDGQTGFMVNTGDFWQCSYMDWSNSQW